MQPAGDWRSLLGDGVSLEFHTPRNQNGLRVVMTARVSVPRDGDASLRSPDGPPPQRAGAEQPVGNAGRPKPRLDALFRPLNADEDAAARRPYLDLGGKYCG